MQKELEELVKAIDSKWKKGTPPKQLVEPLDRAKKALDRRRTLEGPSKNSYTISL